MKLKKPPNFDRKLVTPNVKLILSLGVHLCFILNMFLSRLLHKMCFILNMFLSRLLHKMCFILNMFLCRLLPSHVTTYIYLQLHCSI